MIEISSKSDTIPEALKDRLPSIDTLRKRLDEARNDPHGNRVHCQVDRDYFDGPKQLSSGVRTVLASRQQPPIYTNRVRPAVNGVLGILEAGRRDPRAMPRNPDDDNAADVCTKTLRYIADESKFTDTQLDVAENFFIEGTGAAIVEMIDSKICVTQIRWEEFYHDPYSRRTDFKDARYMGIYKWKDAEEIKQKYKVRIDEIGDPLQATGFGFGDSYQDRPEGLGWVDLKRKRVVLVEEYAIIDGGWMRIVYIASGVLEYGPSPYLDDKNRPCCPIEAASCYVDRENSRYGMVRDMKPIQDEINAGRSRALHLMNTRTVQQVDMNAQPVDPETVRLEAAKADGVMPGGWQIVSNTEMTNAALMRMQESKSEIERMAPTPMSRDLEGGTAVSGRARQVAQQAGLTELARPLGRLNSWVLRCYAQMWQRARQFWTDPMFIRVTDETRAPEFMQVNEPVLGPVMQPVVGPDGQPQMDPMTGQPAVQMGIGVVKVEKRLAEMDMDLILDQTNDTANLQQEIWAELMELLRLGMSPFSPEFEIAIEMSPLGDKQRILERLKAKQEEIQEKQGGDQQKQAQMQEAAFQLDMGEKQARIEKTQAEAQKVAASIPGEQADVALTAAQTAKLEADTHKTMLEPFRHNSLVKPEAVI